MPSTASAAGRRDQPKHKRKQRKRSPWWAKIAVSLGALLMIVSGGLFYGMRSVAGAVEDSVEVQNLFGESGAGENTGGKIPDGPLNFLLVGLDAREGKAEENSRADTIIVMHIPAAHDRAYLVSIPRDLHVTAKAFPKSGYGGGRAKLTETFFHGSQKNGGIAGGVELLASTINAAPELGLSFNGAAVINFESFTKVVEQLGGVNLCIDQDVKSIHMYVNAQGKPTNVEGKANPEQYGKPATYRKGECRRFAPWEALDYSRQRYNLKNGDYDRQRHQLQLIKAIVTEASGVGTLTNPGKLNNVIKAAGSAFVVDTRQVPLMDFMFSLGGIGGSLSTVKTNAGKINSEQVDGISYEKLTADSVAMFAALRGDQLTGFLLAHPDFAGS